MLRWLRRFVELRVSVCYFGRTSPVEETQCQRRGCREEDVVETDGPALEENLARPGRIEGEPQLHDVECYVLVEGVEDEAAHSIVIGSTVNQQKSPQKTELADRIVGSAGSLHSFHSGDAYSDVGLLNHGHIVSAVTNCQGHALRFLCHRLYHLQDKRNIDISVKRQSNWSLVGHSHKLLSPQRLCHLVVYSLQLLLAGRFQRLWNNSTGNPSVSRA